MSDQALAILSTVTCMRENLGNGGNMQRVQERDWGRKGVAGPW